MPKRYTADEAYTWRAEYDADPTLRVIDLARPRGMDSYVMRSALVWAGGELRRAAVTLAARRKAGLSPPVRRQARPAAPTSVATDAKGAR